MPVKKPREPGELRVCLVDLPREGGEKTNPPGACRPDPAGMPVAAQILIYRSTLYGG